MVFEIVITTLLMFLKEMSYHEHVTLVLEISNDSAILLTFLFLF